MKRVLLSALFCISCGSLSPMDGECVVNDYITVQFEGQVDCAVMSRNVNLAKEIAAARGLLTPERFNFLLQDMPIYLYGTWEIKKYGRSLSGYFDLLSGIHLADNGNSLLHEIFHVEETSVFVLSTAKHSDWDKKGFNAASDEFFLRAERVRPNVNWPSQKAVTD